MHKTTNISVDILKVHPRNAEFFDDIQGKAYEDFKDSIQRKGILSPLIATTDMTVISGHQRLKAARELGIKNVPVDVRDDIEDENEKLEMLLVANFGREKNDENKKRKIAVVYVELKGKSHGGDRSKVDNRLLLKDLAEQLGTSETTLKELLLIERKLTPEIKEILDSGGINKTTASKILVKLSPEDQNSLLEDLGKDRLAEMTQRQLQEYITQIKGLEKVVEGYKTNQENNPEIEELIDEKDEAKAKEREWYEKAEKYKREKEEKEHELNKLKNQKPEVVEKIPEDYESFKRRSEKLLEENLKLSKETGEMKRELEILKSNQDSLKVIPEGVVQKHDWQHFDEISSNFEMLINPYMYMRKYFEELPLEEKYLYVTKLDSMVSKINKINNLIKGE